MKIDIDPAGIAFLSEGFQALSSPARVAIVMGLMEGDMAAGEIVDMLAGLDCTCSVERTNVSKHLAVLREAGIVESEEDGQRRIYRLALPCLRQALRCLASRAGKNQAACCTE
jgi:DNA-binding transcriptional ArsR family regulator